MDTDQEHDIAVVRLADQLMRFVLVVKRGMARFAGPTRDGIEYPAYGLLARLVTDGPRRTTALAEAVYADTSTVSRQTAALIRHGLVERRPDPADGRASILAPTDDGLRVFHDNRRRHNENMATILAGWSDQDVECLAMLLARLNSDFEAHQRAHDSHGFEGQER
ncbi:MAG TPA: MarR family winged helix-turn-helix transcriptional regulator [Pseudonocardiaceae bacterium]|jgi:DNA-binding MarR family transcriptional regulator|nr:MarR family winged helix-turn-helix transcriptional regulator [Pseudonocardiaceae bacterium]